MIEPHPVIEPPVIERRAVIELVEIRGARGIASTFDVHTRTVSLQLRMRCGNPPFRCRGEDRLPHLTTAEGAETTKAAPRDGLRDEKQR